jgi:hypothetical protein
MARRGRKRNRSPNRAADGTPTRTPVNETAAPAEPTPPEGSFSSLLRGFLRWDVTLGLGFGLITCGGITVAAELFKTTVVLMILAGLQFIACLLLLPGLRGNDRWRVAVRWAGIIVCAVATGAGVWFLLDYAKGKELAALSGTIVPGDEDAPRPANALCGAMNAGGFDLILGGSHLYSPRADRTIIQVDEERTLALSHENGRMALSMIVRSDDGKVVVEVEKGEFLINHNNYLKMKRPNEHELTVYDQNDNPVLEIKYLNPSALIVNADLRTKRHHIEITPEGIKVDGRQLQAPGGGSQFCASIPAGDADIIVNDSGASFGVRDKGLLPAPR